MGELDHVVFAQISILVIERYESDVPRVDIYPKPCTVLRTTSSIKLRANAELTQADLPASEGEEDPQSAPGLAAMKPWPKKIAEQIAAVRDRVAFAGKLFTVESVAAAFKGAKKKDIEDFLDGFAALGLLTAFEGAGGKRWRAAGRST